jgi:hypothetical protein
MRRACGWDDEKVSMSNRKPSTREVRQREKHKKCDKRDERDKREEREKRAAAAKQMWLAAQLIWTEQHTSLATIII